jgi:hypothetical protein
LSQKKGENPMTISMLPHKRGFPEVLVQSDEPVRVEAVLIGLRLHVFVYEGYMVDPEQDPVCVFDGTLKQNSEFYKPGDPT